MQVKALELQNSQNITNSNNSNPPVQPKKTPYYKIQADLTLLKIKAKDMNNENKKFEFNGKAPSNDNLGFRIKNILIDCKFNGEDCSSDDFIEFYSFEYGNCYTFNGNGTGTTRTVSRTKTGLQMELFTGIPGDFSFERGMYVTVHNKSMVPLTKYEGVKASVGTSTDIGITRTFINKLDAPYSDCRKDVSQYTSTDSYYFKYIIDNMTNTVYTQNLCYQVCFQDMVNKKCGCDDATNIISLNKSIGICKIKQLYETCIPDTIKSCLTPGGDCDCADYCPLECDSMTFSTSVRSSYYVKLFLYIYFFNLVFNIFIK